MGWIKEKRLCFYYFSLQLVENNNTKRKRIECEKFNGEILLEIERQVFKRERIKNQYENRYLFHPDYVYDCKCNFNSSRFIQWNSVKFLLIKKNKNKLKARARAF